MLTIEENNKKYKATEVCSLEMFIYLNHYKKVNIEYIHKHRIPYLPSKIQNMFLRMLVYINLKIPVSLWEIYTFRCFF